MIWCVVLLALRRGERARRARAGTHRQPRAAAGPRRRASAGLLDMLRVCSGRRTGRPKPGGRRCRTFQGRPRGGPRRFKLPLARARPLRRLNPHALARRGAAREGRRWEAVCLPVRDADLAFGLAVDIARRSNRTPCHPHKGQGPLLEGDWVRVVRCAVWRQAVGRSSDSGCRG